MGKLSQTKRSRWRQGRHQPIGLPASRVPFISFQSLMTLKMYSTVLSFKSASVTAQPCPWGRGESIFQESNNAWVSVASGNIYNLQEEQLQAVAQEHQVGSQASRWCGVRISLVDLVRAWSVAIKCIPSGTSSKKPWEGGVGESWGRKEKWEVKLWGSQSHMMPSARAASWSPGQGLDRHVVHQQSKGSPRLRCRPLAPFGILEELCEAQIWGIQVWCPVPILQGGTIRSPVAP